MVLPEEIKMTCTYYGGDTSRFVRNVLTGVTRHENFPAALKAFQFVKESPHPQRGSLLYGVGTTLFAHGDEVLSNRPDFSTHVFIPLDATAKTHKSFKSRVDLEFLAQCKLLDMPTYELALKKKRPSPVALVMRSMKSISSCESRATDKGVFISVCLRLRSTVFSWL